MVPGDVLGFLLSRKSNKTFHFDNRFLSLLPNSNPLYTHQKKLCVMQNCFQIFKKVADILWQLVAKRVKSFSDTLYNLFAVVKELSVNISPATTPIDRPIKCVSSTERNIFPLRFFPVSILRNVSKLGVLVMSTRVGKIFHEDEIRTPYDVHVTPREFIRGTKQRMSPTLIILSYWSLPKCKRY